MKDVVSTCSQLGFVKNNEIHEELLCFAPLTSTTGAAIADCILNKFVVIRIWLKLFSGGKDAMEPAPLAWPTEMCRQKCTCCIPWQYTHCCRHVLNVVVSGALSQALVVLLRDMCSYSVKRRPHGNTGNWLKKWAHTSARNSMPGGRQLYYHVLLLPPPHQKYPVCAAGHEYTENISGKVQKVL